MIPLAFSLVALSRSSVQTSYKGESDKKGPTEWYGEEALHVDTLKQSTEATKNTTRQTNTKERRERKKKDIDIPQRWRPAPLLLYSCQHACPYTLILYTASI